MVGVEPCEIFRRPEIRELRSLRYRPLASRIVQPGCLRRYAETASAVPRLFRARRYLRSQFREMNTRSSATEDSTRKRETVCLIGLAGVRDTRWVCTRSSIDDLKCRFSYSEPSIFQSVRDTSVRFCDRNRPFQSRNRHLTLRRLSKTVDICELTIDSRSQTESMKSRLSRYEVDRKRVY